MALACEEATQSMRRAGGAGVDERLTIGDPRFASISAGPAPADCASTACPKTLVADRGSCERHHRARIQSTGLVGRRHLNPWPRAICQAIAILVSLFSVRGVAADFDGDGKNDILWRKTSTGSVSIWLMNGGASSPKAAPGTVSNSWVIQGFGDFNGDRKADVLWRNTSTGE